MNLHDTIITTARLKLIPINQSYADVIFTSFTPEITEYMFPAPAKEISETLAFINSSMKQLKEETDLVLVILKDDAFCGCLGLHNLKTSTPEIGIWLRKKAHGFGYGFEAVCSLIEWARSNCTFDYLLYPVDEKNIPSRRIPEKLAGKIIGYKDKLNLSGKTLHTVEFAIY